MPRLIRRIGHAPPKPLTPEVSLGAFNYRINTGFRVFCGDIDNREVYVVGGSKIDTHGASILNSYFICSYDAISGAVQRGYGELDDSCYVGNYPAVLSPECLAACRASLCHQSERHVVPINWPADPDEVQPSASPVNLRIEQFQEGHVFDPGTVICVECGAVALDWNSRRYCCPDRSYRDISSQDGRLAARQFRRLHEIRSDVCQACDYRMDADLGRHCQQGEPTPYNRTSCRFHSSRMYQSERRRGS